MEMTKKLKWFIGNFIITMIGFGCVLFLYEHIGALFVDKYYTLILWGLRLLSVVAAAVFAWVGIKRYNDGDFLIDD